MNSLGLVTVYLAPKSTPNCTPKCGGMWANGPERRRTTKDKIGMFSGPFKAKDEHIRTEKWCPEEDSNLHAVASAST